MLTLWDLIDRVARVPVLVRQRRVRPSPPDAVASSLAPAPSLPSLPSFLSSERPPRTARRNASSETLAARRPSPRESMDQLYERITREMLRAHSIRVRKWRSAMSGVAWQVRYADGSLVKLIEAPRPRGPMSAAVFLHEVGHHAIGFNVYKPRCLEEYHAWRWSIDAMNASGITVTDAVRRRMHDSLWYAVQKARRRGLKDLPQELLAFQNRFPRAPKPRVSTPRSRAPRSAASPRNPA